MPSIFLVFAVVMLWHKYSGEEKLLEVLEVRPPPSKNPVEQILTLQDAISKLEDTLQAGNIVLLKFRAVLFAAVPKVCLRCLTIFLGFRGIIVSLGSPHPLFIVINITVRLIHDLDSYLNFGLLHKL